MSTALTSGIWLPIVAYRDYWDIPRLLLTQDAAGFWILDGAFDDALDDHSSTFKIYHAGSDAAAAMSSYEAHHANVTAEYCGEIGTAAIEFDESRRRQLRIGIAAVMDTGRA